MVGVVPRPSLTPGVVRHPDPVAVGADNEEIYCGRLGLRREELAAPRARGVVQGDASRRACFECLFAAMPDGEPSEAEPEEHERTGLRHGRPDERGPCTSRSSSKSIEPR